MTRLITAAIAALALSSAPTHAEEAKNKLTLDFGKDKVQKIVVEDTPEGRTLHIDQGAKQSAQHTEVSQESEQQGNQQQLGEHAANEQMKPGGEQPGPEQGNQQLGAKHDTQVGEGAEQRAAYQLPDTPRTFVKGNSCFFWTGKEFTDCGPSKDSAH